jgi:excinuclease ABC subunit C
MSLKIIQHIRNEAHRFGINFHRDKRSSGMTKSSLDEIKGIGPKTKDRILKNYGSVAKLKSATRDELENLIGRQKAAIILDFIRKSS